jgi:heptosyltransferase III
LNKIKKILIIIQRSNGDVFLSISLINNLYKYYQSPKIDLLVNDDTYPLASLLPNVNFIHKFSYLKKQNNRFKQEKNLVMSLFKKYDLSINLTASDRSVFYALVAGKKTISAVEADLKKSWWKKISLTYFYYFDSSQHILLNNLEPLKLLKIKHDNAQQSISFSNKDSFGVKSKLKSEGIDRFIIFHPSAQYDYKVYPKNLRDKLLNFLNTLEIPIVITGGNSEIDLNIKNEIPSLPNIYNFIGETSLKDYLILSELALAYVGMDTLNMHIAASQSKRIFAIFGSTKLSMWSPWSNQLKASTLINKPIQTYGKNTIFQSSIPCEICGVVGCGHNHDKNIFPNMIKPEDIFKEVKKWNSNSKEENEIATFSKSIYIPRKILLYIVYGEDQVYYDGAIFSFLTFKHWLSVDDQIEIVVLTEKPEKFAGYQVNTIIMSDQQKKEWSLNGEYHFRIKNRGLAYVMDKLELKEIDKILFFDTDTYFHKSPLPLFDLIKPNQALFYLNEGLIYDKKRFRIYIDNLESIKINIDDEFYELSIKSALWGSLMVGIMVNMRPSLDWADKLMLKFFDLVPSHTIEPFSLSESLLRNYKIVEGKNFVSLYSTSRKKEYAKKILANFFLVNKTLNIDEQVRLAQNIKIKRPLFIILKQRFQRIFNK